MKKIILILALSLSIFKLYATDCDIANTGMAVTKASISVNDTANFYFSVLNFGSAPGCVIPVNSVEVAIDMPAANIEFVSVVAPTGSYFTWTYNSMTLQLIGINHTPIPRFGNENVMFTVKGTSVTGTIPAQVALNITQNGATSNDINNDDAFASITVEAILPVTLTDIVGTISDCNKFNLNWKAYNEVNVKEYQVEISYSANGFSNVKTLSATGSAEYNTSVDVDQTMESFYVRVKSVDKDGRFQYSNIVNPCASKKIGFVLYPNPVDVGVIPKIKVNGELSGRLMLTLLDSKGAVLRKEQKTLPVGQKIFDYNPGFLPQGEYRIVILDEKGNQYYLRMTRL
jgi:hypothetical protein